MDNTQIIKRDIGFTNLIRRKGSLCDAVLCKCCILGQCLSRSSSLFELPQFPPQIKVPQLLISVSWLSLFFSSLPSFSKQATSRRLFLGSVVFCVCVQDCGP